MRKLFKNAASDIPASVVVFLVALPLCLGIALGSGAPLFSGIIAGIALVLAGVALTRRRTKPATDEPSVG